MRIVLTRLFTVVATTFLVMGHQGTGYGQSMPGMMKELPPISINLYVTLEFENFIDTDSAFDARNVELLLDAQLNKRLSGFAELEFERAKKAGEVTGDPDQGDKLGAIEVEQGWVQYKLDKMINFRGGVILVPFGSFNLLHFDPFQDLTDRPIMARRVIPVTWAEAGAGFLGTIPVAEDASLDYQVFFVNGLTDMISDRGLRDARGLFGKDNNNNKAVVGQLSFYVNGQELGASLYSGGYDTEGNKITGYDLDGKLVLGPLEILGEYALFDLDKGLNDEGEEVPDSLSGAYVQANYHFWFEFLNETFLGRDLDDPSLTAVVRWGFAENADDGDGAGLGAEDDNRETRTTVGLNYRPDPSFIFKVEYQANETDAEKLERGDSNGWIASVTAAF